MLSASIEMVLSTAMATADSGHGYGDDCGNCDGHSDSYSFDAMAMATAMVLSPANIQMETSMAVVIVIVMLMVIVMAMDTAICQQQTYQGDSDRGLSVRALLYYDPHWPRATLMTLAFGGILHNKTESGSVGWDTNRS